MQKFRIRAVGHLRALRLVLGMSFAACASAAQAQVSWTGNGDGTTWSDGANWSTNAPPQSGDNVTINVAANPNIVSSGNVTINSLVCNENLRLTGGTFTVTTTADINSTLALEGTNLSGGSWDVTGGTFNIGSSNTNLITNATVTGDMLFAVSSARVRIAGTTTFTRARFQSSSNSIGFPPGYVFNGEIIQESPSASSIEMNGTAGTFTLGPAAVVRATSTGTLSVGNSFWYGGNMTLINLGTISDDTGSASLTTAHISLAAANISNRGLIRVSNGGVMTIGSASGTFVNEAAVVAPPQPAGTVTIGDGSRVTMQGNWDNNSTLTVGGTLNAVPARLTLDGVNESADLGTFTSAGEVYIVGTLNNTGGTLTFPAGGSYTIEGGRISGGTLNQSANPLRFTTGDNRLIDVQVLGELVLDGSSVRARLEGSTSFGILRMRGSSALGLSPGYVLSGEIVFEGPGNKYVEAITAGTFTIAPGGKITTSASPDATGSCYIAGTFWYGGAMTIVNQGTITHNASGTLVIGQTNTVGPLFTNAAGGTLTKAGPGTLQISTAAWSNQGTINAGAGTMSFSGNWNNTGGVLNLTNATLNLGGTFSTTQMGTINRTGGTVNLTGTLNNTGSTLVLNNATGSWNLNGGTINGGTVTQSGAGTLRVTSGDNALSDITLPDDLVLPDSNSRVRLLNSNTVTRIRMAGVGSSLGFSPGATFAGEIVAEGTTGTRYIETTTNNGVLNLSPTARVVVAPGFGGQVQFSANWYGTPSLNNLGTISMDGSTTLAALTIGSNAASTTFTNGATGIVRSTTGATITVMAQTISNAGMLRMDNDILTLSGAWTNTGTIELSGTVTTPGTAALGGSFSAAGFGTLTRSGTTVVRIDGDFNLGGGTFNLNAATGDFTLGAGTIRNGTLGQLAGTRLLSPGSTGTLQDLSMPQTLNVDASGRIKILGASNIPSIRLGANDAGIGFAAGTVYGGTIMADGPPGERSIETVTVGTLEFSPTAIVNCEGPNLRIGNSYWFGNSTTVTNRGRISSGAAGRTVTAGGQNFVNTGGGRLESQNGGLLVISAPTWSNAGVVTITPSSTFTFAGNWTNAGGVINATDATINVGGNFTRAQLGNFNRTGGTLNFTGVLDNTGQTLDLNAAFGDVTLAGGQIIGGTVNQSASRLRFSSDFANRLTNVIVLGDLRMDIASGRLRIEGTTSFPRIRVGASSCNILVPADYTLTSEILVEAGGTNTGLGNAGAGTFTIAPSGRISVSGASSGLYLGSYWVNTPGMTIVNQGLMEVSGIGARLEYYNQSVFAINAGTVTSGIYRTRSGGQFSFIQPPASTANQPTITAIGPGAVFDLQGNVNNSPVPFTGLSTLRQVDGVLRISGPDLAITPLGGTLINNGLVATGPGTSLNITGAYQMGPAATHEATIAGSTAVLYGTTIVSGNAAVDGTFRLLAPGFEPGCGLRYLPIDAATLSGTFDTVDLPPPSPNSVIVFEYKPGGVGVRGFIGVSGFSYADFNNDGVVDDFDFVLFTQQYEVFACDDPSMPGGCKADLNDDGFVDDFDFVLFTIAYEAFLCP